MFQIFQVKCFNLEIFEIFETCPGLKAFDSKRRKRQRNVVSEPRASVQAAPNESRAAALQVNNFVISLITKLRSELLLAEGW